LVSLIVFDCVVGDRGFLLCYFLSWWSIWIIDIGRNLVLLAVVGAVLSVLDVFLSGLNVMYDIYSWLFRHSQIRYPYSCELYGHYTPYGVSWTGFGLAPALPLQDPNRMWYCLIFQELCLLLCRRRRYRSCFECHC
jgi:hypothetical protein